MQLEEAKRLREKWEASGAQNCKHPEIHKEYYGGAHTMDYVCIVCGEEFSLAEKKQIEAKRI